MARRSLAVKVNSATIGQSSGGMFGFVGHVADVISSVASTTVNTDVAAVVTAAAATVTTTVAANVATLVADGATPTQGHVNTLNTNWAALLTLINTWKTANATLNTDWTALSAGLGAVPGSSDVVLSYNASTVVSKNVLRRALQRILEKIDSASDLTD